jgi:hypothetical protein
VFNDWVEEVTIGPDEAAVEGIVQCSASSVEESASANSDIQLGDERGVGRRECGVVFRAAKDRKYVLIHSCVPM